MTLTKTISLETDKYLKCPYSIIELLKEKREALRKFLNTKDPKDNPNFNYLIAKVRLEMIKFKDKNASNSVII